MDIFGVILIHILNHLEPLMWVKGCHCEPTVAGDRNHSAYKDGDDWGEVGGWPKKSIDDG